MSFKILSLALTLSIAGLSFSACTGMDPVDTREDRMTEEYSEGTSPGGEKAKEHQDLLMRSDEGQEHIEEELLPPSGKTEEKEAATQDP